MRAIIIDNEPNIVSGLTSLIENYCPEIREVFSAYDLSSSLELIRTQQPDIVFLDIELDDCTGMDLLNTIGNINFQIIFITAYHKYALEAFKFSAIDYLLKPIDPDDLIVAVQKAQQVISKEQDQLKLQVLINNLQSLSKSEKKIVVSDKDNIYAVDLSSILYLKADGPYTKIVRINDSILTSKNLKHYENMLIYAGFYRTHHSYLANLSHMKRFDKVDSVLELNNGEYIPVSVRKKEGLLNAVNNFIL